MFDPIQKALDVYGILLSAPQLSNVNVVFYRKLYLQNTSDYMRAITAQRNNGSGAGIIVLEPWARCNQKNVLIFDWIFPVVSVENPTINMMQGGSNLSAYQMAQNVADILHNYADDANGTMNCDSEAIQDETEVSFEGCVSKRTNLHILGRSAQTVRLHFLHFGRVVSGSDWKRLLQKIHRPCRRTIRTDAPGGRVSDRLQQQRGHIRAIPLINYERTIAVFRPRQGFPGMPGFHLRPSRRG